MVRANSLTSGKPSEKQRGNTACALGTHDSLTGTGSRRRKAAALPADEACNRFQLVLERVKRSRDYRPSRSPEEPYGTFQKRHIIGEHTKINGGVYLGVAPHEALVVDDKYGALREVYTDLMVRYVKRYGGTEKAIAERRMLEEIVELVKEKLRYMPEDKVQKFVHDEDIKPDKKMALDLYLQRRAGTDRHQVLLAAYLLERLLKKGLLKGKVYLDAHYLRSGQRKEKMVYSSATGYLFIFSPSDAQ